MAAIVDHRNPTPTINRQEIEEEDLNPIPAHEFEEYGFNGTDMDEWTLPGIATRTDTDITMVIPQPEVSGYRYHRDRDQPYHLEVWCEKSTMNDVLRPVCERYGANLVTSLGFQSITSVIDLLKRIEQTGKPTRLFYISDFDPAGELMPVGVARQVEYWREDFAQDSDIRLTPLALTRDQVKEHELPTIPIKDSDRRKNNFEARNGEGAVELDALEALHPGELGRMLKEAFGEYFDDDLEQGLENTHDKAQEIINTVWHVKKKPHQENLAQIEAEYLEVCGQFQEEVDALTEKMDIALGPVRDRLKEERQALRLAMEEFQPELPERPDSMIYPLTELDEWLFDSGRDYEEQLDIYHEAKEAAL